MTHSIANGAKAGLMATAPMTLFMLAAYRLLPSAAKEPLPPEQITARAARTVGLQAHPQAIGWEWKTYLGHFSYGMMVGALYPVICPRPARSASRVVSRGGGYGLAVWALSYLGWLPALGILPPASRQHPARSALMIGAHLVWGLCLVALLASREVARPPRRP